MFTSLFFFAACFITLFDYTPLSSLIRDFRRRYIDAYLLPICHTRDMPALSAAALSFTLILTTMRAVLFLPAFEPLCCRLVAAAHARTLRAFIARHVDAMRRYFDTRRLPLFFSLFLPLRHH